jgi:hypothetical protein
MFLGSGRKGLEGFNHFIEYIHKVDNLTTGLFLLLLTFLTDLLCPPENILEAFLNKRAHEMFQIYDEVIKILLLYAKSHNYFGYNM